MLTKRLFDGYLLREDGAIFSEKRNIFMRQRLCHKGYSRVSLMVDGRCKTFRVHRLVADLFIGKSTLEVNHKDMSKTNNHFTNLEYMTTKENVRHSLRNGIHNRTNRKLSVEDVIGIRGDWVSGKYSCTELGTKYKISRSQAHEIAIGKSWHIMPKGDTMAKAAVAAAKGKGGKKPAPKKQTPKKGY